MGNNINKKTKEKEQKRNREMVKKLLRSMTEIEKNLDYYEEEYLPLNGFKGSRDEIIEMVRKEVYDYDNSFLLDKGDLYAITAINCLKGYLKQISLYNLVQHSFDLIDRDEEGEFEVLAMQEIYIQKVRAIDLEIDFEELGVPASLCTIYRKANSGLDKMAYLLWGLGDAGTLENKEEAKVV